MFRTVAFTFIAAAAAAPPPTGFTNPDPKSPVNLKSGDTVSLNLIPGDKYMEVQSELNAEPVGRWVQTYAGSTGYYPLVGPQIDARQGDLIEVTATNELTSEGHTIHWHGMFQLGTPFYDGVDMISQCPISPGETFTYRYRAEPAGTHWYHSHTGVQYGNGLRGPLIVQAVDDPYKGDYDFEQVFFIHDWEDVASMTALVEIEAGVLPDAAPWSDTPWQGALINGYGPANPQEVTVEYGKRYRLRIINGGASWALRFSIEDHAFEVIATDGIDVERKMAGEIGMAVGERYDVILTADHKGPKSDFPIIVSTLNNQSVVCAVIHYIEQPRDAFAGPLPLNPPSAPQPNVDLSFGLSGLVAYPGSVQSVLPLTTESDRVLTLGGTMPPKYSWWVNESTPYVYPAYPPTLVKGTGLELLTGPVSTLVPTDSVIDFVINNPTAMTHPMHLHGHNFWLLGTSGWCTKDAQCQPYAPSEDDSSLNLDNPIKKDNIPVPAYGWVKIRVHFDNPGPWFFHCHIEYHLAAGMDILVQVGTPSEWDWSLPADMSQCGPAATFGNTTKEGGTEM